MFLRITLSLFCLFLILICKAQTGTTNVVEPQGQYKNIDLSTEMDIIKKITDPKNKGKATLINSVQRSANDYTPSLLYIMSSVLFNDGKQEDAMYWFYLAQLRARYDTNRCADKTASPARYNSMIGPPINEYAFKHLDVLKRVVDSVVNYVKINEENYDPRWINIEGMGAFTSTTSKQDAQKPLSLPKEQWPAIKAATIDDYYNGFKEMMEKTKSQQK